MLDFPESHFLEEEENVISFFAEDIEFELQKTQLIRAWIEQVIAQENAILRTVNYIFCSDDYLHKLNLEYLQHDTLTDIITFPYNDPPIIHSDIFISIDRVRANAKSLKVAFSEELHRVIIHGILHLCGYADKTAAEAQQMREKEETMLKLAMNIGLK